MTEYVGPNGPVMLPARSYDHFKLRALLEAALAGADLGRTARVEAALLEAADPISTPIDDVLDGVLSLPSGALLTLPSGLYLGVR